ncbi:MAG: hypothetical protein V1887_02125 [Candidatus Aenigmatarchaeota archaeon]
MSKITTVVMPEPEVRIIDGEFRFTGKAVPVTVEGCVLDYLRAAGAYDSKLAAYNGSVIFDDDFSVKERLGEVDEILAIIDGKRLEKDLEKKGYALLMAKGDAGKFRDYKRKGFIANADRIIQELVYQRIPEEFKLDFGVRHFKAQESAELMNSDKEYKATMDDYWNHNLEVIQKLAKQKAASYRMKDNKLDIVEIETEALIPVEVASVRSTWHSDGGCFDADAGGPSLRHDLGVCAAKKAVKTSK